MVENPLLPADYVNGVFGVQYLEETEDFLDRIGHLATPDETARFEGEATIEAAISLGLDEEELEDMLSGGAEEALAFEQLPEHDFGGVYFLGIDTEGDAGEGEQEDGEEGRDEGGEGGERKHRWLLWQGRFRQLSDPKTPAHSHTPPPPPPSPPPLKCRC